MPPLFVVFFVATVVLLAGSAHAAVGDDCSVDVCPPGELCLRGEEKSYCTIVCDDVACPEGYYCRPAENVARLCAEGEAPPEPSAFGEACGAGEGCEVGTFCADDGIDQYCTRFCNGPGTCPDGYQCMGQDMPACAIRRGAPGLGEPCAQDEAEVCAGGLTCSEHASRGAPFCTLPCMAPAECPDFLPTCEPDPQGQSRCVPDAAARPTLGETCTVEGPDPNLVGCADPYICAEQLGLTYCTQACDISTPCPDGYGCQESDGRGLCRTGADDDVQFRPPNAGFQDVGVPGAGGGGQPLPDAGAAGGGGAGDDDGSDGGGCAAAAAPGVGWLALLALVIGRLTRRPRGVVDRGGM
jgi:hypothetical protein